MDPEAQRRLAELQQAYKFLPLEPNTRILAADYPIDGTSTCCGCFSMRIGMMMFAVILLANIICLIWNIVEHSGMWSSEILFPILSVCMLISILLSLWLILNIVKYLRNDTLATRRGVSRAMLMFLVMEIVVAFVTSIAYVQLQRGAGMLVSFAMAIALVFIGWWRASFLEYYQMALTFNQVPRHRMNIAVEGIPMPNTFTEPADDAPDK